MDNKYLNYLNALIVKFQYIILIDQWRTKISQTLSIRLRIEIVELPQKCSINVKRTFPH